MKLLEVNGLQASIKTKWQTYHAIEDVTFSVEQGEILGIVGESGCGKSMTALSILRLVASPPVYITGGEIRYRGKNLLEMDEKEIRKIRGNKISMIFQEPMTSLNPVYTVGNQITEVIRLHQKVGKEEAQAQALQMLRMVGIPAPMLFAASTTPRSTSSREDSTSLATKGAAASVRGTTVALGP